MIISVATLEQLKKINPKTEAALLAGVGKKRKLELMTEAEKLKITLVNFNAKSYKDKADKFFAEKKKEAVDKKDAAKQKEEAKKTEEKAKKAAEKEEQEEMTPEEKQKQEKAEKDKILIQK
jgi:hypothetical protein